MHYNLCILSREDISNLLGGADEVGLIRMCSDGMTYTLHNGNLLMEDNLPNVCD